ncbi:MAG: AmmeMemoRadiSam system radical SAM enzyme [Micrococcales bacterium]|nr:AmmeMemoRadiSam system radical SAM enzyme [Micrococcales bacterium]
MSAQYWHGEADGRVACEVCPRRCVLREGQRGFCFVRRNVGGRLELSSGPQGFCVDPVEKKPLYHVAPGSSVLSFGTVGCNLRCRFCQNWELSAARELPAGGARPQGTGAAALPSAQEIASMAVAQGCRGVAYTYNDPVIFAEYAMEVAAASRELGLLNIAVTAGFINPEPRSGFFGVMDAANVDLKSLSADFYRRVVGGRVEVVQDTLRYLVHETTVWVEVTTLVIPGYNDSDASLTEVAEWIAGDLGVDVPWHVSAFHPAHRMMDVPRTPASTLRRARKLGILAGLRYVYVGNVWVREGATTFCPGCAQALITRDGYAVREYSLTPAGQCEFCSHPIPGLWAPPDLREVSA